MLAALIRLALVLVAWVGIVGLGLLLAWRLRVREERRRTATVRHDLAEHLLLSAHSAQLRTRKEAER